MPDLPAQRKTHVKALRACARACGIPLVRDDVGQERVRTFAASIAASRGPRTEKAKARDAYRAYAATWPAPDGPLPLAAQQVPNPDRGQVRLRGTSFLLTYNWDFFHAPFPDGTPGPASPEALWACWRDWKAEKKQYLRVKLSTSSMERSLNSDLAGRVHIHWKVNLRAPVDTDSRERFAFHGVLPDLRHTNVFTALTAQGKKSRGKSFEEASNRGHFYVWAPKEGTLFTGSNYKAFDSYRVLGKWLDDLWTDGKLAHTAYEDLARRVRIGYAARKRDIEQVRQDERERRIDERLAKVGRALEKLKAPPRSFPEVRMWEDSFLTLQFRWKILVLRADSASGKSTFAEGLFTNPYVITVEEAVVLDLKGFDYLGHDGIVLDNVNTFAQLLQWRAILQGRNAKSKGGQSATNVFAYSQYLFGVPVVATLDLDAPDAHLIDPGHAEHSRWLVKNTVRVELPGGETFYDSSQLPVRKPPNRFSLFAETVKRRRERTGDLP